MPIDRDKRLVFLHIPKTGGTTIEKILGLYESWPAVRLDILRGPYEKAGEQLQLQHLSLAEVSAIAAIDFSDWYKFAFVRNPFDRLVSSYCFKRRERRAIDVGDFSNYVDWVESVVSGRDGLTADNCHLRPQVEFELRKLDFIGRFENFEVELKNLFETLSVPVSSIPHAHKSRRGHYAAYYDDKTKRRVAEIYAADIEELDYAFEG